jgi:hypothetical protein
MPVRTRSARAGTGTDTDALDGTLVNGIIVFYETSGGLARWLGVLLHAFWVPQVVHNMQTGAARPLALYVARSPRAPLAAQTDTVGRV